jgi:hypothetical protein
LQELLDFLKIRFQSIEAIASSCTSGIKKPGTTPDKKLICKFCQKGHIIYKCAEFQALSINERQKFVQSKDLCVICLCHFKCRKPHNTLLHLDRKFTKQQTASNYANSNNTKTTQPMVVWSPPLMAQKTEIGWIISGTAEHIIKQPIKVKSLISRTIDDQMVSKFWEIDDENSDLAQKVKSIEEKECEEHYLKNVRRSGDGTFTVGIPFKTQDNELGSSRSRAAARLIQLEKHFVKDKKLEKLYKSFMKEYLELNHMRNVDPKEK